MPARRVIVSVTNDLVTDQRVHRSCSALCEAGYDVLLVGRLLPGSATLQRPYATERMRLLFKRKAVFYAEYNIRLFLKLMVVRADAFYANDTDALPANWLASRLRRKPLFFDAHEMFPEVPELVGRQRVKRFWTWIEHRLFPTLTKKGSAAVTVCQSIADIYAQRYGLHMEVVRNVPMAFPVQSDSARKLMAEVGEGRRILLYQGAVNIGRGIEWIVQAMPLLPECVLVVAGVGDIYDELRAKAATMDNVRFLGRVSPEVLHGLTGWASLGLSLLENRGLNYYYSLPNRIADFVQAGVPVLATDFPEIRRVVEQYGIGTLVAPVPFDPKTYTSAIPDPAQTAQTIRDALAYWDSLPDEERKARFTRAAADLNWNNDKKKLLMQFDTIF
jgi:glycosyltransferase involved in cell wall biosynthesis